MANTIEVRANNTLNGGGGGLWFCFVAASSIETDREMERPEASSSSGKRKWGTDSNEKKSSTTCLFDDNKHKKVDNGDPFGPRDYEKESGSPEYGSVIKEIEHLLLLRKMWLASFPAPSGDLANLKAGEDSLNVNDTNISTTCLVDDNKHKKSVEMRKMFLASFQSPRGDLVNLKAGDQDSLNVNDTKEVIVISSDDDDDDDDNDETKHPRPFQPVPNVVASNNLAELSPGMAVLGKGDVQGQAFIAGGVTTTSDPNVEKGKSIEVNDVDDQNDKSIEDDEVESEDDNSTEDEDDDDVMVEEDESDSQSDIDPNEDIWNEMRIGLESSKEMHPLPDQKPSEDEQECDHYYILKDDIGYVCRVCGMVQMPIDSVIEFQRPKTSKSIRTYHYEGRNNNSGDTSLDSVKLAETDFTARELTVHQRHKRQMKPHQVEGFNFLLSNLESDNPGGCILTHAPGSGKTFLLISFIQSFMAKYPDARPLVVLPRGILGTWKKEFIRWQVEDMLLLDMYSAKAEGRVQQLQVLKQWANQRSILFLGYQQFSSVVCDIATSPASISCQDLLINCPTLLVLDEGHTPRNKETNVFTALAKVKTPMKVVLSGTLFQNHVTEVFNILNLVRPKFLKMETSKAIKTRIMGRVEFKSHEKSTGTDSAFYELVERTLVKDNNFKRKAAVIEDLREMTGPFLQYYKGDMLDELPGLVDFTVFLKLTPNQERAISEAKKAARNNTFRVMCDGSAIYVHPELKSLFKNKGDSKNINDNEIDELLEKVDGVEGVKAKFFMNMLRLCESAGEKLLVFSQYLLPLKFLVRLTVKTMGWSVGKQIFMITGGHDNDERELAMDQFNNSSESRVFFGSIKACGEGISLVGASRIIILDVPLNPSVTRQALGRSFRPGQTRKVYTYRLIAADAPEQADHVTCFKKESVAKMWFEWNEFSGHFNFDMETVSVKDCGDRFLETSSLNKDVIALSKR
ncbi:protein CHROMATIN REMODELING 35-like [Bidens hawaiensis]|uniref:protein CHROMATIN REMODELING 35-like n=1 Tax=Bidens hawaiensis TaxID=980011 RepID=UPI004049BC0F